MSDTRVLSNDELAQAIDSACQWLKYNSALPDVDRGLIHMHLESLLDAQANRAYGEGASKEEGDESEVDDDGVPYVDDDGTLEPWAQYVATEPDMEARQYESDPVPCSARWPVLELDARDTEAPYHYAITDRPWQETLRRVRR